MRLKKMNFCFIFFTVFLFVTGAQVQAGTFNVHAGTHPPTVSKGQPTEIRVEVLSAQGTPVPGAHVKISAGGGVFLHSNNTVVHGQTDPHGVFVTPWKCMQCAPAYVFGIEVTKPGFKKWVGDTQVNISAHPAPPGPGQGGPITVHAGTHPPTVPKGNPTEIRVEAVSNQGTPIPDADVKISAGGGVFLHSNNIVVHGKTDEHGVFVTPWKCMPCAAAYVFDIEVTKPGFEKGTAKAKVNIGAQPFFKPLKPLKPVPGQDAPINVHAATHPPTVSKGNPTEIRVEAISNQGTPIPDADVKILAGGGVFLHSNNTVVHGKTDEHGVFVTPWKCMPCAAAYVFDIEVTKPGFKKGTAKAKVNITL